MPKIKKTIIETIEEYEGGYNLVRKNDFLCLAFKGDILPSQINIKVVQGTDSICVATVKMLLRPKCKK